MKSLWWFNSATVWKWGSFAFCCVFLDWQRDRDELPNTSNGIYQKSSWVVVMAFEFFQVCWKFAVSKNWNKSKLCDDSNIIIIITSLFMIPVKASLRLFYLVVMCDELARLTSFKKFYPNFAALEATSILMDTSAIRHCQNTSCCIVIIPSTSLSGELQEIRE